MTISTLHTTIQHLASQFAAGVLEAIRGASLEDILAETSGGGRGRRAARSSSYVDGSVSSGGGKRKGGRLPRRSAGDIAAIVGSIVSLLHGKPNGLRAEEIRAELGLEAKELPRPIGEALASRKISKQGQKRATTYFARGSAPKGASRSGRAAKKAAGKGAKRVKAARGGRRGGKKASGGASAGGGEASAS